MLATALLDFQRRIGGAQIEHLHRIGGNQAAGARDPHRRRGNRGLGGAPHSAQCSFGVKGHIPGRLYLAPDHRLPEHLPPPPHAPAHPNPRSRPILPTTRHVHTPPPPTPRPHTT